MTLRPSPGGRRHRFAVRLLTWVPRVILHAPERCALKIMCIIVGVLSLWSLTRPPPFPGSVASVAPPHIVVEWSLGFIVGGTLTLVGMQTRRGFIERAGLMFFAFGCFWFAFAGAIWGRGFTITVMFTMIALASLIRLGLSSVVRKTTRITMMEVEEEDRSLDDPDA